MTPFSCRGWGSSAVTTLSAGGNERIGEMLLSMGQYGLCIWGVDVCVVCVRCRCVYGV